MCFWNHTNGRVPTKGAFVNKFLKLFFHTDEIYSGMANGRVLTVELYTQILHLFQNLAPY